MEEEFMDKNRQEPFTIEIVDDGLGAAAGIRDQDLIIGIGPDADKAIDSMISNPKKYSEIAGDKETVNVLNLNSSKQSVKGRNGKDVFPEKKMSQELFGKACGIIEKMKERILDTISTLPKKIMMGAVIALTTASIFAGGLGRSTEKSLQERYSSLNPTFGKNWETTINVTMSNSSLASDYLCDFVDGMAEKVIEDYVKKHGEFKHANMQEVKKGVAARIFNSYSAKNQNLDSTTTYTFDDEESEKFLDEIKAEDDRRKKEKGKEKKYDGPGPDDGPNPEKPNPVRLDSAAVKQLIQFNNGQINPDNTVTFRYQADSFNQARTDATNWFQLFISACSLNGLTPTAKDLGDLTRALNGMKVTQNGSGYVAEVVVSNTRLNTVLNGLDSNNAKAPTQHNTSRNNRGPQR